MVQDQKTRNHSTKKSRRKWDRYGAMNRITEPYRTFTGVPGSYTGLSNRYHWNAPKQGQAPALTQQIHRSGSHQVTERPEKRNLEGIPRLYVPPMPAHHTVKHPCLRVLPPCGPYAHQNYSPAYPVDSSSLQKGLQDANSQNLSQPIALPTRCKETEGTENEPRHYPAGYSDFSDSEMSFSMSPCPVQDDDITPTRAQYHIMEQNLACADIKSETKIQRENTEGLDMTYYKPKVHSILRKHPNGVSMPEFLQEFEQEHSKPFDFLKLGYPTMEITVVSNKDVFMYEKPRDSDMILYSARHHNTRYCPIGNRQWVPNIVQDDLAALSKQYPNGIETDKIISLYKEKYASDIDPEAFGFGSVVDLLHACSSVFVKDYEDTCLVYPKCWIDSVGKSLLLNDDIEPVTLPSAHPTSEKFKYLWHGHYKEYECDPSFKYTPPTLPDEEMVQVKIVEMQSPGLFWIQFLRDVERLDCLMSTMSIHYNQQEESYRLPDEFLEPDLAVAIFFEGNAQWHRARIESFEDDNAKVVYVDFGTVEFVERSQLRKLDKRFGREPIFAVKASMHCLRPPNGTDDWPEESYELLGSYCNIPLHASIREKDTQDPNEEDKVSERSKRVLRLFTVFSRSQSSDPSIQVVLCRVEPHGQEEEIVNQTFITKKFADSEWLAYSILNLDLIGQFLPLWLTTSTTIVHDKITTMSALKMILEPKSFPIVVSEGPCCIRHLLQVFFRANPIKMGQIWEYAYLECEDTLLEHVCAALLPYIDKLGWTEYLDYPISCVGENTDVVITPKMSGTSRCSSQAESESTLVAENTSTQSAAVGSSSPKMELSVDAPQFVERPPSPSGKAQPRSSRSAQSNVVPKVSFHDVDADGDVINIVNRMTQKLDAGQISVATYLAWCSDLRANIMADSTAEKSQGTGPPKLPKEPSIPGENPTENMRATVLKKLVYPKKAVTFTVAYIDESPLHLILYDSAVWVCMAQLYQLTELPLGLTVHRVVAATYLNVTESNHPELSRTLKKLGLFPQDTPEDVSIELVLLDDAAKVLEGIGCNLDPGTFVVLSQLMKKLIDAA